MTFGNTNEALQERSVYHQGERLLSEREFNLILGGTLLWGFALNWLMIKLFSVQIFEMVADMGPGAFYIVYFALALIGTLMIASDSAVMSFAGFNLLAVPVGVVVCIAVGSYSADVVRTAVLYTGAITALFMAAAVIKPDFFLSMDRVVITGLSFLIIGEMIIGIFTGNWASLDFLAAALFGMFIGVDWARCAVCQPTANNAVDSAANLYLDIINLFLRLMRIINRSRRH